MRKLQLRLSQENILTSNEQSSIKGGKRLITSSYSRFCNKRDQLQSNGTTIKGITHIGNQYCLEW